MQINHRYHGDHFASVEAMFDPARNVDYAARFLKELRAREGNWTMAVATGHNAGPNNTIAQRRYICSVIGSLVASGFGSWTTNARTYWQSGFKRSSQHPGVGGCDEHSKAAVGSVWTSAIAVTGSAPCGGAR